MTTRDERKAAQAAKIAATSLPKRLAVVGAGGLSAFAAGVGTSYLLSGDPRLGFAIVMALAVTGLFAHQYLVVPSRQ